MAIGDAEEPGVIDAALLSRLVPVWSVISPQALEGSTAADTKRLSRNETRDQIRDRLEDLYPTTDPGWFDRFSRFWGGLRGESSDLGRPFDQLDIDQQQQLSLDAAAEIITDALPEEVRTSGVIVQLNLPQFVNALGQNPDAVMATGKGQQVPTAVISSMSQVQQVLASEQEAATAPQTPPGTTIDPATGELILQAPGQAAPTGASAMDVRLTQRYNQIPFDGLPLQVDLSGVVQPMRPGRTPGAQFGGFVPDAVTGGQMPTSIPSTVMPLGVTGRSGVVNAKQAADYLYSLSPQEVEQLQDRMRAAGYFTEIGYDQDTGQQVMMDVPFEPGYSDDPATSAAWIKVIADAIGQDRSGAAPGTAAKVDQLLRTKSMDYERRRRNIVQDVRGQRTTSFAGALSNVREMADQFAIETLGRRLSAEEFVGVRDYVRKLQRQRVGEIAGQEMPTWMAEAPTAGFTQEEVGSQVRRELMSSMAEEPGGNIWDRLARKYLGDGTS